MKSQLRGALVSVKVTEAAVSAVKTQSLPICQSLTLTLTSLYGFCSGFYSEQRAVLGKALHRPDHSSGPKYFLEIKVKWPTYVFFI